MPTTKEAPSALERETMRRVAWRIVPFMMLCYLFAILDRGNVGMASLQMNKDLGMSKAMFGFGASLFFVSYFLMEVPSNLALQKFGARLWIARIMITWGIISACMALVQGQSSFYVMRFILGAAEAGFFPGVLLYLVYWLPSAYRGRLIAIFGIAIPAATFIGSPLGGVLLNLDGMLGLRGWQWMFILEGVPTVLLGIACLFVLTDKPEQARWLRDDQRAWLVAEIEKDRAKARPQGSKQGWGSFVELLRNPYVWAMALACSGASAAGSVLGVWQPQLLKSFGLSNLETGLINSVPYGIACVLMVLWGAALRSHARAALAHGAGSASHHSGLRRNFLVRLSPCHGRAAQPGARRRLCFQRTVLGAVVGIARCAVGGGRPRDDQRHVEPHRWRPDGQRLRLSPRDHRQLRVGAAAACGVVRDRRAARPRHQRRAKRSDATDCRRASPLRSHSCRQPADLSQVRWSNKMSIGFRILNRSRAVSADAVTRFKALPVANISDCMNRMAAGGAALRPLHGHGTILAGPAVTVRSRPGDNLMLHKALDLAAAGDVVVVDGGGDLTNALIGELMIAHAQRRGLAGIVINGAVRDSAWIAEHAFPIYAAGVTHRGPYKDGPGEINVPIAIGGMVIEPGDLIVGDADGFVSVPYADVENVYRLTAAKHAAEEKQMAAIAASTNDRSWVDAALERLGCEMPTKR